MNLTDAEMKRIIFILKYYEREALYYDDGDDKDEIDSLIAKLLGSRQI